MILLPTISLLNLPPLSFPNILSSFHIQVIVLCLFLLLLLFPILLLLFFFLVDNPLSPIGSAHMCMSMGPSTRV